MLEEVEKEPGEVEDVEALWRGVVDLLYLADLVAVDEGDDVLEVELRDELSVLWVLELYELVYNILHGHISSQDVEGGIGANLEHGIFKRI